MLKFGGTISQTLPVPFQKSHTNLKPSQLIQEIISPLTAQNREQIRGFFIGGRKRNLQAG
jgi:hypothetical protein